MYDVEQAQHNKAGNGRPFGSLMGVQEGQNLAKDFLKPTKDIDAALKSTRFETPSQAMALTATLFQMSEFEFPDEYFVALKRAQDAQCSVNGWSSLLAMMTSVQVIAPSLLNVFGKAAKSIGKVFSKLKPKGDDQDAD